MSAPVPEARRSYGYIRRVNVIAISGMAHYVIGYRGETEGSVIVDRDGNATYYDAAGRSIPDRADWRAVVNSGIEADSLHVSTPVKEGRHEFTQRRKDELKAADPQRDVLSPDVLEYVCHRAAAAEWDTRRPS